MLNLSEIKPGCSCSAPITSEKGEKLCHYAYRTMSGILYSVTKKTLKQCIESRNNWLNDAGIKEYLSC